MARSLKVLLVVAMFMAFAAPAMAVVPASPSTVGTITVPTHALIPATGGNPSPLVKNVWVFDGVDWKNGAVMTGSPATGGGSGQVSGGGIGGGGTVNICAVVDPNGNNMGTMAVYNWIKSSAQSHSVPLANLTDAKTCIDHAFAEDYITEAYRDELYLKVLNSQEWGIYCGPDTLEYCDPAGGYTATVKALAGQAYTELGAPFTYLDVVAMDVDFNKVDFQAVMPGGLKKITGDYEFNAAGSMPTAQNLGNVPLALSFIYSEMRKANGTAADVLNQFDLEIQAATWADADKEVWPTVAANQRVFMAKELPLCNRAKMNFSVHAPVNIQDGDYNGTFTINFCKFGSLPTP